MTETRSEVDIDVPAALVWGILADFRAYGRWNPLIRGILGHPVPGGTIEISLRTSTGQEMRSRPTVVFVREEREMKWLDRWRIPGLFTSERRFRLVPLAHGGVRFHHEERAQGMLVSLLGLRRRVRGQPGFDAMASALKQRAERVWAQRVGAAIH
jgi:hypothetical protein